MQTQQTPQVLAQPFAAQGDKNTIPNAATGTNKASLQEGFPPITETPINNGGVPPERKDFNGAMNLNSQFYFAFQNGWWPTFSQEVSDAIGGYPKDAVLWLFDTSNRARVFQSLIPNNAYNFKTNPEYIGEYWKELINDSLGASIGQIIFSQSNLAADNPGCLPLWTGEYYANASTLYPDFYAWVKSHPELCKTKAEYDSAIAAYGECPYYVVDEVEGSLRLPKYASNKRQLVKKEANGNDWYALYSDGWLEQGGYFGNPSTVGESAITETFWKSYATPPTVLFGNMSAAKNVAYDFEHYPYDVTTNGFAHKNTMPNGQGTRWYAFGYAADTPMENILYPWVCAYTSAIPASTAQAAEFTGALSGKANTDLSNVLANIDYVVESKLPTADDPSWYRKYKSGWVEQGGVATAAGTITFLKPFANTNYSVQATCLYTNYTNWGFGINKTSGASFSLNMNIDSQGAMWEAKGQGAE